MGRRVATSHPWEDEPGRILLHENPYHIWAKLNWEANEFHIKRISERPLDIDGMVYLLQDACISVVATVEWLQIAAKKAAREAARRFDEVAFAATVAGSLPHLPLARAIANTFKHGAYRDEGWGDAEVRLEALFSDEQHKRLRAAQGREDFDRIHAEEAVEADYQLSFTRGGQSDRMKAEPFVLDLANGALRLLDATYGDLEQFFASS